jgi:hypothetical protein
VRERIASICAGEEKQYSSIEKSEAKAKVRKSTGQKIILRL